jgi:hypothetical protein
MHLQPIKFNSIFPVKIRITEYFPSVCTEQLMRMTEEVVTIFRVCRPIAL